MIIFIKKIKTKEGINSFDNEKIKKDIPHGYIVSSQEPAITLTANHALIAFQCEKVVKPVAKPAAKPAVPVKVKSKAKPKAKSKKAVAPREVAEVSEA